MVELIEQSNDLFYINRLGKKWLIAKYGIDKEPELMVYIGENCTIKNVIDFNEALSHVFGFQLFEV